MNRSIVHTHRAIAALATLALAQFAIAIPNVWINEFHYDNVGGDSGEFVEIAGTAGLDLNGITLTFYNGGSGTAVEYGSAIALAGVLTDAGNGFGFLQLSTAGLQNGTKDGFALSNSDGLIQFLSYEGVVTAADGPAAGTESEDIGVSESSATPIGYSLQLVGSGLQYIDFTWSAAQPESPGALNVGQSFPGLGNSDPATGQPVPDPGATGVFLTTGLLGIHLLRRKRWSR